MKKIKIEDLCPGVVTGVVVSLPVAEAYKETYFEWTPSSLTSLFKTCEISGGVLKAWKHVPLFSEIETHVDAEIFYFLGGTALMLFADMKDGQPQMNSLKIVRIQPGTQIIIEKGKAHFVPVAEDDTPVSVIVVAPKMEALRVRLEEEVLGIL